MIRLHLFGPIDLRHHNGSEIQSVLAQPKRTALLSYLAAVDAGKLHRRGTLLALLWPELDEARARNALSKSLHHLRQSLGDDAIVVRANEEVGLSTERVWCDVAAFQLAGKAGDYEQALKLVRNALEACPDDPELRQLELEAGQGLQRDLPAAVRGPGHAPPPRRGPGGRDPDGCW